MFLWKCLEECPKTALKEIQKILSAIDHDPKSIQKTVNCYNNNRFFVCSFNHQTCAVDRANSFVKPSPPCKDVFEYMETDPVCKISFKFAIKMHRLSKICPALFAGHRLNFTAYPRKNIPSLESCQMDNKGWFFWYFCRIIATILLTSPASLLLFFCLVLILCFYFFYLLFLLLFFLLLLLLLEEELPISVFLNFHETINPIR